MRGKRFLCALSVAWLTAVVATAGVLDVRQASANEINIPEPSKAGFGEVTRETRTFDVTLDGWACGAPISDEVVLDQVRMAELEPLLRYYALQLVGLQKMKDALTADPKLGAQLLGEIDKRVFGERFDTISSEARKLTGTYQGDEPFTPEDAATRFGLNLTPRGLVGANTNMNIVIGKVVGDEGTTAEYELGECYSAAKLVEALAEARRLADALKEALDEATDGREKALGGGAGS